MDQQYEFFHFDNITVDLKNFRVTRESQAVVLTPRAFDVLVVLLKNAGRVVEKQEIFDAVWKDTFVTDNALVKVIKELRGALGDEADKPHFIETVPKRGYRFIAPVTSDIPAALSEEPVSEGSEADVSGARPVTPATASEPSSQDSIVKRKDLVLLLVGAILVAVMAGWILYRQSTKASPQPVHSIAVLPFKPLSADSRDESLEMGMAETLINRLSNVKSLAVRPITAVRKFTDPSQDPVRAGEETKAEAVLDGNIQKAGDRIRVTVRLIDVASGANLWTEKFDESLTDIFKVQDSIAERVTKALLIELSRGEQDQLGRRETNDPVAYQEYLQCQLIWHGRRQNWIQQSRQCYENVVNKDPNFALAYIGAAESYLMASGHLLLSKKEAAEKARPYIAKALEIDSSLALAHNAKAELLYQFDYDWKGADEEFKKALELNPNVSWIRQAHGWFLMTQGRFEEAEAEMDMAKALDPSSITIDVGRGRLYYFKRDYEKARLHFEKLIELEPEDSSLHYSMYTILEQQQKYAEAVERHTNVSLKHGAPPEIVEELRAAFRTGGWQGFLEKQLEIQKTRGMDRMSPWLHANHFARMGRKDEAFQWLEKSFDMGEIGNLQLKIDPLYDGLRDDPRYARLLARIGMTP